MFFLKQFIFAFISTLGFSILFNIPRVSIIKASINGAFGWIIYITLNHVFFSPVIGSLWGALIVGIVGEIFARIYRKPATVFIIPGIVPLVPGSGMYYTMQAVIEKNFYKAAEIGSETIFIAAAISIGIILSSSLSRLLRFPKKRKTA